MSPPAATASRGPGLQCSWIDEQVMAWVPGAGVWGGALNQAVARVLPDARAPFGSTQQVMRLRTPAGPTDVLVQRILPSALAVSDHERLRRLGASASVRWMAAMAEAAYHVVGSGRVVPMLDDLTDGRWQARWRPLEREWTDIVDTFAPAMPEVVMAADHLNLPEAFVGDIVNGLVDELMRVRLAHTTWRSSLRPAKGPAGRATRALVRALSDARTGQIIPEHGTTQALGELSIALERLARRAAGEPVITPRLRLAAPQSPDDPWPVTLELVDADDPSKWCTVHELADRLPNAERLAGNPEHEWVLQEAADHAVDIVTRVTPWLTEPTDIAHGGVGVDDAARTLDAVDALRAAGLAVIVPQGLIRARPTARGVAIPRERSDGRFGATALVQWQPVVEGHVIDEEVLERAHEQGSALLNLDGSWVQIDRTQADRLLQRLRERRDETDELGVVELLQLSAQVGDELRGEGWAGEVIAGLPDTTVGDGEVPSGFLATLRPYQQRGLGWLQFLHRLGLGGCLADDMGLGKTPTTLAHLAGIPGPHLVVCPLSVVRNWQLETHRFTPFMRVAIHHGSGRADATELPARVAQHDIVITTYQVAARDIDALAAVPWQVVVLDEAQAIKNPQTTTAKAIRRLPAAQRVALTGTPVENRLTELWSILHTVVPGLLGNITSFRGRFATPIERHHDADAAQRLRRLTAPFVLRRTKADKSLVPDLPDKVEQVAWATLTPEQARLYQGVVDQLLRDAAEATGMRRRGLVLAALTKLKQICNHPAHALGDGSRLAGRSGKLHRFDELVADLLEADEQALVFTQFTAMGELLRRHLAEAHGLTVPFLHGGVARRQRDTMVDEFQAGAHPLLLVSLKAGGTGLNLTAASRVVHYDRWWNPAVEDQATDRAWRIGQQQSVFVHKLVCEGTVEERIDGLIADKRGLAEAVIGTSGEAWLSELSTDELRDLVVLDLHEARAR
jgi:hypothetical protein